MNKEVVYYWDIHNKKLTEKRRKNVIWGYTLSTAILLAYSLIFIPAFLNPLKYEMFILVWIFKGLSEQKEIKKIERYYTWKREIMKK